MEPFAGKQDCALDEKRRFSLPPRYRPIFGAHETPSGYVHRLVLIPWYGGALALFTAERWRELADRLNGLDYTTPEFLEAKRTVFSRVEAVQTDPEGRVTLSPDHVAWLELNPKTKDRLMLVGVGSHLEAWNLERWTERDRAERAEGFDRRLETLMRAARAGRGESGPADLPGREPER
jgi:division/cell wall cluster transcriptional repressor MraZ